MWTIFFILAAAEIVAATSNLSVSPANGTELLLPTNSCITLNVTDTSKSQTVDISIDNSSVSTLSAISTASIKLVPANFSSYGTHQVTIESPGSFFWFPLIYEEVIGEFSVIPSQSVFMYETTTNFTVSVSNGTNLLLQMFIVSQGIFKFVACSKSGKNFVVPYDFQRCQNADLKFSLSNGVYKRSLQKNVTVVPNANDFNVTFPNLLIVPPDPLQIYIQSNCLLNQTNITATLLIDNQGESPVTLLTMNQTLSKSIIPLGKQNVTVVIRTPLNSAAFSEDITVITHATLKMTKQEYWVGDKVYFVVDNTTISQELFKINISDGVSNSYFEKESNTKGVFFKEYQKDGVYNISWTLGCPNFIKSGSLEILVYGRLDNITVDEKSITIPDGLRKFEISVESSGSVTGDCFVSYGDGTEKNFPNLTFPTKPPIEKNYTKAGNYTFNINCTAASRSVQATALTHVTTFDLNDFSLNYSTIVPLGTDSDFLIRYRGNQDSIFKFVTTKWDFGDGDSTETKSFSSYNKTHVYKSFGNYSGFLDLAVLSKARKIQFNVQAGIIDFSIENTVLANDIGVNGTLALVSPVFTTDSQITYKITFSNKNNVLVCKENIQLTAQPRPFTCKLKQPGAYSLSVAMNGSSFQETFAISNKVYVINRVTDLKLDAPEKVATYQTLKLKVSAGPQTQDLINVTCEFTLSNGQNQSKLGDITNTSIIEDEFKNLQIGEITVQVHCFNKLSFVKLFKNITIANDCFKNDGLFMKKNREPSDPIELQNSVDNSIKCNVEVKKDCEAYGIFYVWTFRGKNSTKGASFTISKNGKPGTYRIDLTVTSINSTQSDHVYIKLTIPDVEAIIQGGSAIMTSKENVYVDAASLSYDPSEGQGKTTGLSFSWSCRMSADSSKTFNPSFDTSSFNFEGTPRQKGCPPLTDDGKLQINPSDVKAEQWYVFQVQVSKNNRTASAVQAIFITPLDIIPLQIGCVINCLQKIATNQEAVFKVEFSAQSSTKLSELSERPSYKWKLRIGSTDTLSSLVGAQINGPRVELPAGSLVEDASYQLVVTIGNLTGYANSIAVLDMKTNRPPENGKCTVDPMNGTLNSTFNIDCDGWQDPDGIWKYIIVFEAKGKQFIISDSRQTISSGYRLPIGDKDDGYNGKLVIRIYDIFEAYSQVNYTIQVKPDESAAANLLDGDSLEDQMTNNPEAVMKNAGNVISTLNTIKTPPASNNSVANIEKMPEEEMNEMFSQDASQVNQKWDSIVGSLSVKNDKKQKKIEKKLNDMTKFVSKQVMDIPPTNEIEVQEKTEVFMSIFENPKLSLLDSAGEAMDATAKLGGILSDLSEKRPIDTGLQKTIDSVANLVGTMFGQITPDEPLSSEPMTLDRMRKKLEMEFPNPDSPISIEERAFLALKTYQRDKIKKEKQSTMSRSAVPKMINTINKVANAMSALAVRDGPPVEQSSKNLQIGQWKVSAKSSPSTFQLQGGQSVQVGGVQDSAISMFSFTKNPYTFNAGSDNLKGVISLTQKSDSGKSEKQATGTVVIGFPHEKIKWDLIKSNGSNMIFHTFTYRSKGEMACVKVKPADKTLGYTVYMRGLVPPTIKEFNYRTAVEPANLTEGVYTICFPGNAILNNGIVYVGLEPIKIMGQHRSKRSASNQTETNNTSYYFGSLVAGCSVLDSKNDKWTSSNCKPMYNNEKNSIKCECNNPVTTTFSNSFFVPPNSIDFSTVFSKFDLVSNGAVFGVVIAFICIYLILLVVTRHYDRKDHIRWSVVPLIDSIDTDPFWYVISVYTGLQYGSGTKSRISFKVAGEVVDTQVHPLTDGHKKEFTTGSVLKFLMSTNESLGDMQYLHIWHDNSGLGDNASWYLNKIEITDLQTSESYVFLCNSWLAVEKGDGSISRVLPVSTGNELLSFNNKFFEHTRQKITDEHIWLSIVFRPLKSPFNRKKRLSTAFALLFLTMISNAMFYSKPVQVIEIGPIRFSMTMIWTSFMGIIISTLPIILIMTLFKKSKEKSKHPQKKSPPGELLEDSVEMDATGGKIRGDSFGESDGATLPWFCAYIAWTLVVLAILASGFFVILYSQEWGKEKSEEWLTTFVLSFFESCFIVDPLKVIVVSIILSFVSKKLIKNDVVEEKIEKISNEVGRESLPPSWNPPLGQKTLKQAREKRCSDLRMAEVIQDLFLYIVFLWVIYSLSLDNRDPNAFEQSQQLDKLFHVKTKFKGLQTNRQLLKWINSTFFPNFFPQRNYQGTTLPPLRKLFISDQTNFRMGPARFRILRMKSETCKIPYLGRVKCSENYNILTEDTDGYCIKWATPPCPEDQEATHLTFSAWNFTSATKIWGIPFMGTYSLYGGGGYILNLEINLPISLKMVEEITRNRWIDRETRALFIEFTLYNANVNLFTYVVLLAEIPNIGEIIPYTFFYSFKSLADEKNGMIFVCQLLFVVFISMMLIRSILRMFHMKWAFFKETWYVLDFVSSLSCGAAIGMYIMRSVMIKQVQDSLKADPKQFVNFYHIVVWDQIFVVLMAMLVFLSTIRFLRILGYNKRISAISMVISSAKKDMSGFFTVFIILSWTFCFFGYLLFGRDMEQYKSLWNSLTSMFVGILGKTHFSNLRESRSSFGPIFYLGFVFVFIFFLLKMMESILNESITKVSSQIFRREESISRYLYDQMPGYIRKILFPERKNVFEKTGPEFVDVRIAPESNNDFPTNGVADATIDMKNLNLSSFDMMYQLINKNFDDLFKETYAENDTQKVKF